MALQPLGYSQNQSYFAYIEQSTWGTAMADSSNFKIFDLLDGTPPTFSPEAFLRNETKNTGRNVRDVTDVYYSEGYILQRVTLPPSLAHIDDLAFMLYGAAQSVSEDGTTPFAKTFTFDGDTNPAFSSGGGWFGTFLKKSPLASFSDKFHSCVLERLKISMNALENGGMMLIEGTVLVGGGYVRTANPSGTNALSSLVVPNHKNANESSLVIHSLDCCYYGAEIEIVNTFAPTCLSAGAINNIAILSQDIAGRFVVKYDSNTDVLKGLQGTNLTDLSWTIEQDTNVGYFNFSGGEGNFLKKVEEDYGGTDSIQKLILDFDFNTKESTTSYPEFIVTDGVDRTW